MMDPKECTCDDEITATAISQDGSFGFTATKTGGLDHWDLAARKRISNYQLPGKPKIYDIQLSMESNFLYIISGNGFLSKLSIAEKKILSEFQVTPSAGISAYCLKLCYSGNHAFIGTAQGDLIQ